MDCDYIVIHVVYWVELSEQRRIYPIFVKIWISINGIKPRNKISVITDISVLGFYGNIRNIGKYRWIF